MEDSQAEICAVLYREMELKIRHDPLMQPLRWVYADLQKTLDSMTPGKQQRSLLKIEDARAMIRRYEFPHQCENTDAHGVLRATCDVLEYLQTRHNVDASLLALDIPKWPENSDLIGVIQHHLSPERVEDVQDIVLTDCFAYPFARMVNPEMRRIVAEQAGIRLTLSDTYLGVLYADETRVKALGDVAAEMCARLPLQPEALLPHFKTKTWEMLKKTA